MTYVIEQAGYRNTVGYYTYPKGSPPATVYDIDSLVVIFPSVTEGDFGVVNRGEKVFLGEFPTNTVIGYFVISDGWTGDTICVNRQIIFTDKHLNTYTSEEYRQQTILLKNPEEDKILLGIEDLARPASDNDFNDVVFYITADPFAIDTTDIFKVPAATISGDSIFCDNSGLATVQVDMEGSGPWEIVYTDGTDTTTVENVQETPYIFETNVKDTIRLVSVRNASTFGIVGGSANFWVAPSPSATINKDAFVCEGEQAGTIEVSLEGNAPWSFTYSDGIEEFTITDISEDIYHINAELNQTFSLISVEDRYCNADATGSATLEVKERPSVKLNGFSQICDPEQIATLQTELTGVAPWTIVLEHNGIIDTVVVDEVNTEVKVSEPGEYKIIHVEDAFCVGEVSGGTVEVVAHERPSATLYSSSQICDRENGSITISLTGSAPWSFTYSDGTNEYNVTTSDTSYVIENLPEGTYQITGVEDDFCEGSVEGVVELVSRELPTANIIGDNFICEGGTTELMVNLTGTAPWTFIYSDGTMEEEVSTDLAEYPLGITSAGNFSLVSVMDAYCEGQVSGSVEVMTKELPTAIISGMDSVCTEDETNEITVAFTGDAPWSFVYTDGQEEFEISTDSNPHQLTVTGSGIFQLVAVTDAYCAGSTEGEAEIINVFEELNVEMTNDDFVCFGENINLSLTGDLENITSVLSTDGNGTLVSLSKFEYEYQPADGESGIINFSIELSNSCGDKTITRQIEIQEELAVTFSTSPASDITAENPVTFIPDEDGADSYTWDFGDGNSSSEEIPDHEYLQGGVYTVKLIVEKNGCSNEGEMDVEVEGNKLLYVPNAFNLEAANPENQVVKVYGTGVSENGFHFRIVNRWGKTMYETGSFIEANSSGWTGHNANTGELQSLNVFTYILRGQFEDGEIFERTGTVTLIH
jgi:PKD repeat protein